MIEIRIEGLEELRRHLERMIARGLDLRPLMRSLAGIMHHAVEENFAQEGRPKWVPLSKRTEQARRRRGYWPGKILQMRGELAASISQSYSDREAVVGTNKVYARIHQLGGKAGRGKKATIPARPFLKLTEQDLEDIKKAAVDYLRG
ncbi:MAG: phage virion morphogenesis protein [Hydrogenobacter thermophilus]|nr:phage virion morphogenesis protein [Hydrogenobacter thermophilus]